MLLRSSGRFAKATRRPRPACSTSRRAWIRATSTHASRFRSATTALVSCSRPGAAGADQVLGVVDALAAGHATATPQSSDGLTHARRLEHIDGYVSFTHDAGHEDRIIRSVTPNPGAYTVLPGGARMKLDKATPVERDDLEPGQLEVTKKQVTVGCASGALVLGNVAPAGKSWMDAASLGEGSPPRRRPAPWWRAGG